MKPLSIAIVGTRGIPNRYGGFEECAEQLSVRWAAQGIRVRVYHPHHHPVVDPVWKGVERVARWDPRRWGSLSQFVYDALCILHLRHHPVDAMLQLGYTSSGVWQVLMPRNARLATNVDGLEWIRPKYAAPVRAFLKWSEKQVVKRSDVLIADAPEIARLLKQHWGAPSLCIPYGVQLEQPESKAALQQYGLTPKGYDLVLARIEPENQIELIVRAHQKSGSKIPLIVVGGLNHGYARRLAKDCGSETVRFVGGCYEKPIVETLRRQCRWYIHGHSVGGTNPSLLEAMASGCAILAHRNPFNEWVLGDFGHYFESIDALSSALAAHPLAVGNLERHRSRLECEFDWDRIAQDYLDILTGKGAP
ncbi:DUF1972 domain-containing protein [bacterium]|nr:DUF1972 domain-containing protein [bacterium]